MIGYDKHVVYFDWRRMRQYAALSVLPDPLPKRGVHTPVYIPARYRETEKYGDKPPYEICNPHDGLSADEAEVFNRFYNYTPLPDTDTRRRFADLTDAEFLKHMKAVEDLGKRKKRSKCYNEKL